MTDQELFLKLYERHWTQGDLGLDTTITVFKAYLEAKHPLPIDPPISAGDLTRTAQSHYTGQSK